MLIFMLHDMLCCCSGLDISLLLLLPSILSISFPQLPLDQPLWGCAV